MTAIRWVFLLALAISACTGKSRPQDSTLPALPPQKTAVEQVRGEIRPTRELLIALSGEVRGEIEPCGCPTLPYGGFARRSAALRQMSGGLPLFQLDAGDALLKGLRTAGREDSSDRGSVVLELMIEIGVDLMVPGPSDVRVVGMEGLKKLPARGLRIASATWVDEAGKTLFPAAVVLERGGVRLGVVGLSAPVTGVRSRDAVEAARDALASLPPGLDLVVAVTNLPEADRVRVATEVSGLSALLSTPGDTYDKPTFGVGAAQVEVGDRGRYLTMVRVRASSAPGLPLDPGAERQLRDLDILREQVARLSASGAVDEAILAQLRAAEDGIVAAGAGRNLVRIFERPLGSDLDGPGELDKTIADFKERQQGAARQRVKQSPEEWSPSYATSSGCVRCHSLQFARWTYTGHARATATLVERKAQQDLECVGCHTTGFGEKGGFAETDPATLRVYGGVQCEACHGPLAGHPKDDRAVVRPISEDTCRGCHDPANSPNFDYVTYLPRVACPRDERGAATMQPGSDPLPPAP